MDSKVETQAHQGDSSVLLQDVPLCVDLDGTLVRTNTFVECVISSMLRKPLRTARILVRCGFDHAGAWAALEEGWQVDVSRLPYRTEVLEFLAKEKEAGRELALATGADRDFAERVARHLGLFTTLIGSDGSRHMVGAEKRDALVNAFGERGFDYLGNGQDDVCVWMESRHALAVNPSRRLLGEIERRRVRLERAFKDEGSAWSCIPAAFRMHHWIKNLLVFLPVFLGHKLLDITSLAGGTLAFLAFSLAASAMYLINDVMDLDADRAHLEKRLRPLASGRISIIQALGWSALLLCLSVGLALRIGWPFLGVLCSYVVSTLLYGWRLKKYALLDVFVLAGLYTVRVLAGGVATHIVISPWTAAFCIFLFLSLALVKRHSDLVITGTGHSSRGYRESDVAALAQFGIASGYVSVLVLALYINNPDVHGLYRHPYWLWAACPILCYWISRIWLLSQRGELHVDPVVFALRDRATWLAFALTSLSMLLAVR